MLTKTAQDARNKQATIDKLTQQIAAAKDTEIQQLRRALKAKDDELQQLRAAKDNELQQLRVEYDNTLQQTHAAIAALDKQLEEFVEAYHNPIGHTMDDKTCM